MHTVDEYLDQLATDKETLVDNLETKGVTASDEETFTTLVPKVLDIEAVNNQSKSVSITENGTTSVTPDTGYTGLSGVNITTNVEADMSEYFLSEYQTGGYDPSGGFFIPPLLAMLKKIPSFTYQTSLNFAFEGFQGTELPLIDTSGVTNFSTMCAYCSNIVTLPNYNTSAGTQFNYFCNACGNLENVPVLNLSSVLNINAIQRMFYGDNKLTDTSLDNILQSCISCTTTTGATNKKLSYIGITNRTVYPTSRIQALPHYQDFINAGWTID